MSRVNSPQGDWGSPRSKPRFWRGQTLSETRILVIPRNAVFLIIGRLLLMKQLFAKGTRRSKPVRQILKLLRLWVS